MGSPPLACCSGSPRAERRGVVEHGCLAAARPLGEWQMGRRRYSPRGLRAATLGAYPLWGHLFGRTTPGVRTLRSPPPGAARPLKTALQLPASRPCPCSCSCPCRGPCGPLGVPGTPGGPRRAAAGRRCTRAVGQTGKRRHRCRSRGRRSRNCKPAPRRPCCCRRLRCRLRGRRRCLRRRRGCPASASTAARPVRRNGGLS